MSDLRTRTHLQGLVAHLDALRALPMPRDRRDRLNVAIRAIVDVVGSLDAEAVERALTSPAEAPPRTAGAGEPGGVGLAGPRALVVEDDPINVRVAVDMLRVLGIEADAAGSGEEALQMIEKAPYDLVLMDVMLPHASGIEVTAEIRRRAWTQPFIVGVTALPSAERDGLAAGMDAFLTKPMRIEQVQETIGLSGAYG